MAVELTCEQCVTKHKDMIASVSTGSMQQPFKSPYNISFAIIVFSPIPFFPSCIPFYSLCLFYFRPQV